MTLGCSLVRKSRALAAFRSQAGAFVTVVIARPKYQMSVLGKGIGGNTCSLSSELDLDGADGLGVARVVNAWDSEFDLTVLARRRVLSFLSLESWRVTTFPVEFDLDGAVCNDEPSWSFFVSFREIQKDEFDLEGIGGSDEPSWSSFDSFRGIQKDEFDLEGAGANDEPSWSSFDSFRVAQMAEFGLGGTGGRGWSTSTVSLSSLFRIIHQGADDFA
jgi:hypothetical protein